MQVAAEAVCSGHSSPLDFLYQQVIERPALSLWIGPRGGGKSYLSGLCTWIDSRRYANHGTRILAGSKDQAGQIYAAMRSFDRMRPLRSPLVQLSKTQATFHNGSDVAILAASQTSARGPHVPTLRLDEIDEIDADVREAASNIPMRMHGIPAAISMTSTWHHIGGPMTELVQKADEGAFPLHTFCIWEVLETCPEDRSGPNLELCPACPIQPWCHGDLGHHESGLPKAKRAAGHYSIDSMIQKATVLSKRAFESELLCLGPRAAGVWFTEFSEPTHVSEAAEFDPALPIHISVDSGVWVGAVLFQQRQVGDQAFFTVFDEYLAENPGAEASARAILALADGRCGSQHPRRVSTDRSGGARNPVGPIVLAEYARVGLKGQYGIEHWHQGPGSVQDSLNLVEVLLGTADGTVYLLIHPRCKHLITAFKNFSRAKAHGQWVDVPAAEQHPHEEMIDALRGALKLLLPQGRKPQPKFRRVPAGRFF